MTKTATAVEFVPSTYANPAGYYLAAFCYDGAVCVRCYGDYADYARDNDEPVGHWHETDAPVHCEGCGALLETTLTRDGVAYVLEALDSNSGDLAVLAAWREAYGDDLPKCPCGNLAVWHKQGNLWLCDFCDTHAWCVRPTGVTFYAAQFTGEPRAKCDECGHVWAAWECAGCELGHDSSDHDVA